MDRSQFKVIAFAASLGGVSALRAILSALPATFPAAILIVQHRGPDKPFLLPHVLGSRAVLPVVEAKEGEPIRPSIALVAPPGLHMVVTPEEKISFSDAPKVNRVRPSADPLFETVAAVFGPRAIAVVLTGYDGDGSDGAAAVKEMGGTVIVQDIYTAAAPGMPLSALKKAPVDLMLPLDEIPNCLQNLVAK